ncbi:hypothetical protein GALMADRAFT_207536 [Galerina marginata CBS 339.88]|uniref:Uncharacterized protein n=1 Tax=Galerina marginata (strain CBS 339.88) TaxID=685588 RepID=A0A067TQR0_GALM3|nr:hypothetical protein GALMADRAFT_207536 [Galerina marginata CBS 339.88]
MHEIMKGLSPEHVGTDGLSSSAAALKGYGKSGECFDRDVTVSFPNLPITLGRTIEHGRYTQPEDAPVPIKVRLGFNGVLADAIIPGGCFSFHYDLRLILRNFQGIVYVVDTTSNDSIRRSKEEIEDIVNDNEISQPILILVSLLDASGNPSEENVAEECNLSEIIAEGNERVALFVYSLSSTKLSGFMEGFSWLLEKVLERKGPLLTRGR